MADVPNLQKSDPPQLGDEGLSTDDKQWAMFAHLAALFGLAFPFGSVIGPLVVWQLKSDRPFVVEQGKEALNFHISVILIISVLAMLGLILGLVLTLVVIGVFLLSVLPAAVVGSYYLTVLVFSLIGGIRANQGEHYRYPLTWRLIK